MDPLSPSAALLREEANDVRGGPKIKSSGSIKTNASVQVKTHRDEQGVRAVTYWYCFETYGVRLLVVD